MGASLSITGAGPPRILVLGDKEIIVGRSVKADIQVDGDLVSRQHCRIFLEGGRWRFADLGSRNGTVLNGTRCDAGTLENGDVLMVGYGKFLFEDDTPPDPGLPADGMEVALTDDAVRVDSAILAEPAEALSGATMALSYRDLMLVMQRVQTISKVGQRLAVILDRDELMHEVMSTAFELYPQADRGAIVLRSPNDVFRVAVTHSRTGAATTTSQMNISTRLIKLVQKEKKAVLSENTDVDSRFAESQSLVATGGRSIMCAPLMREQEFLGVVYLDTATLSEPFTPNDLNLLQGLVGPVAVALKNADLVSRIEDEARMRTSLSRYLSPDVVRQIGEGTLKPNLGGEQVEGTVMFSDIVGFTAMSERLQASEVLARLNRYFTQMLEAIFGWNGTVDKFGGDAIMAVWGAPVASPDHPHLAVSGGLEMQQRLFDLNCAFEEAGENLIGMALGFNSGKFVAGNIGGAERIEWTVIGDNVNLAQRVESQGFRGCVLCSESTFLALPPSGSYRFQPVHVKNRVVPVTIYSIRSLKSGRGTVCSIPGELKGESGTWRALVVKTLPRSGTVRATVYCNGTPKIGEKVVFTAALPEQPTPAVFSGKVAVQSPLMESKSARAVDVDVESADPEASRLLNASGVADAKMKLSEIQR